jgi:phage tail-like protein
MPANVELVSCSDFYLTIDGAFTDAPVQEFSNLGAEVETSDQIAGTSTGGIACRQSKPGGAKTTDATIVLPITKKMDVSKWFDEVNPTGAKAGKYQGKLYDGKVTGYADGSKVVEWQIKKCFPRKYSVSTMKAGQAEIMAETIEIVITELTREQ